MKPTLRMKSVKFTEAELRAWKKGDYSIIEDCFRPLKQVLRRKARVRPGRFFGEARVAASERHLEGWYGSFKWLTSPKWFGSQKLGHGYETRFRTALLRHFPELREFQRASTQASRTLRGRRPVGPDLWLTTARTHRFIEVKLPGDRIFRHQLVGLALIAMFLRGDRPLRVEIITLYCGERPAKARGLLHDFDAICAKLSDSVNRER